MMVDFAHLWEALFTPGIATSYFDVHNNKPFEMNATTYSPLNAWWLAELSRLVYRQEHDEIGGRAQPPTRTEILHAVGLHEFGFFSRGGTQCAVVGPRSATYGEFTVVVFRGTHSADDWRDNVKAIALKDFQPEPWPRGGRVHVGFREALDRVWNEVDQEISRRSGPLYYTGHSLGAALATLAAGRRHPHAVYTYGSPQVGDADFADTLKKCHIYRVVNDRDVVATVPPESLGFQHGGELHHIGRVISNASQATGDAGHQRAGLFPNEDSSVWTRLVGPPEFLEDHTPVNYVAYLERAVT